MGATKIIFDDVNSIDTRELIISDIKLKKNLRCKIISKNSVQSGDTILVKASFLDSCIRNDQFGNPDQENVLYRRRVIPFVCKVKNCQNLKQGNNKMISVDIERINISDSKYLYKMMGRGSTEIREMIELEAKKITFIN